MYRPRNAKQSTLDRYVLDYPVAAKLPICVYATILIEEKEPCNPSLFRKGVLYSAQSEATRPSICEPDEFAAYDNRTSRGCPIKTYPPIRMVQICYASTEFKLADWRMEMMSFGG